MVRSRTHSAETSLRCAGLSISLEGDSFNHERILENLVTQGSLHDVITALIHLDAHRHTLSALDRNRDLIDSISNLGFYAGLGAGSIATLLLGNFSIVAETTVAMLGAYAVKELLMNKFLIDPVLAEAYPRALELSDPSTAKADSPGGTLTAAMLLALEKAGGDMPRAYRALQLLRLLSYNRIPREELEDVVCRDRFDFSSRSYPLLEQLARKYCGDYNAQDPIDLEVKMITEISAIKDAARKLAKGTIERKL
ncbi:MAG: hypothetical protein GYA55_13140 [SAR324 cluster bacterium]|uniref:Uncharacterized protein n=1 Tax=SAR324 cluster bacterium TaxID=2024889 RepID=A0A7X9FTW0_9DELT|nr:hypothetical protein [SAR324 cluster bacterium]